MNPGAGVTVKRKPVSTLYPGSRFLGFILGDVIPLNPYIAICQPTLLLMEMRQGQVDLAVFALAVSFFEDHSHGNAAAKCKKDVCQMPVAFFTNHSRLMVLSYSSVG